MSRGGSRRKETVKGGRRVDSLGTLRAPPFTRGFPTLNLRIQLAFLVTASVPVGTRARPPVRPPLRPRGWRGSRLGPPHSRRLRRTREPMMGARQRRRGPRRGGQGRGPTRPARRSSLNPTGPRWSQVRASLSAESPGPSNCPFPLALPRRRPRRTSEPPGGRRTPLGWRRERGLAGKPIETRSRPTRSPVCSL